MKAREKTYTPRNIKRAFEATGIWPVNERRVLDHRRSETRTPVRTPASRSLRFVPATPGHGRAILIHGRHTLNVLPRRSPHSKYCYEMVNKLYKAAARATAKNVILEVENDNLRRKAASAEDRLKTRSRKELSKAQVIEVEDVTRIREEQEAKERLAAERKAWAALKKAQAPGLKPSRALPKTATGPSSRTSRTPNKKHPKARKVVILDSPVSIHSDGSEWDGIDTEWEEGNLEAGDDEVEDTIVVQAAPRMLRSTARGGA